MTFFRKRQDQDAGLEDRLRSLSGKPREDFVRNLGIEVRASRVPAPVRSRRFVAALVTTALMAVPFVAFGGVHYAAAAAKGAAQAVSNSNASSNSNKASTPAASTPASSNAASNNTASSNAASNQTPADDQYKPGKGCGDKNHIHEREDECKKPPK